MGIESIPRERLAAIYRTMYTIRTFEEKVRDLFFTGAIPGFAHVSIGQEAAAVGVCAALEPGDRVSSTHRGHGHLIAKGGELRPMMAEIFGKRTGYCKGKGGSMHIASFALGILGANGIVGAGIPIATGAALAAKLLGERSVAVAFFGDGAANEGTFHESLNLAAVWKLPVFYVCENNRYAEFSSATQHLAIEDIAVRAAGYGMPGVVVDGNDVVAVYEAAAAAAARARAGEGPTLIECKTYRWEGHVVGEQAFLGEDAYRPRAEVEEWKARCPIAAFERRLVERGLVAADALRRIREEVRAAVEDAASFAAESPLPDPEEALADLYADS